MLEQIILLASRGVLTSFNDVTTLLQDQSVVSAFATLGIDLAKFNFEKSPVQGHMEITPGRDRRKSPLCFYLTGQKSSQSKSLFFFNHALRNTVNIRKPNNAEIQTKACSVT